MAIMQDLSMPLRKIAKMQDGIKLLTRTKSAKCTLGPGYNAADNLSVTLRTNCPFGFGLRHFAADHKIRTPFVVLIGGGQNVRHQQREVMAYFAATSTAT